MVWVLVVVLVIVAAAAVLFALKERRSRALKQDFGPEYQRTVQSTVTIAAPPSAS